MYAQVLTIVIDISRMCGIADAFAATRSVSGRDTFEHMQKWQQHTQLAYFVLSLLWEWGFDPEADALAAKGGLFPPSTPIAIAAIGQADKFALSLPNQVCCSLILDVT